MRNVLVGAALAALVGCAAPVAPADAPSPMAPPAASAPAPAPDLPPSSYSVAIDPGLSADDVDATMTGIAAWEAAVPVRFDVTIAACAGQDVCIAYGPPSFTLATPDPTDPSYQTVSYHGPAGFCSWSRFGWGGRIQLDLTTEASGPANMAELVEHELGHAMGLVHHAGDNVMNATMQSVPISADDAAQWVDVHAHGPAADAAPQA